MSCKQTERSFLPFPWQRLPSKNSLGYREICGAQWNNKAMDPSMLGVTFLMEVQKGSMDNPGNDSGSPRRWEAIVWTTCRCLRWALEAAVLQAIAAAWSWEKGWGAGAVQLAITLLSCSCHYFKALRSSGPTAEVDSMKPLIASAAVKKVVCVPRKRRFEDVKCCRSLPREK